MLTLAFWNIGKHALEDSVVSLLRALAASVGGQLILCLAEPGDLHASGAISALAPPWRLMAADPKFVVITNTLPGEIIATKRIGGYYFIALAGVSLQKLNVCFAHAGSPFGKWNKNSNAAFEARKLRTRIEQFEIEQSIAETVILGDLNMDPHDPAMIDADGLHAAMCRNIASRRTRTFGEGDEKTTTRLFYNPMWKLLGDRTSTNQPGSFYNSGDRTDAAVWHCIDQVLLRPELIPYIYNGTPQVLTAIGASSLLTTKGVPDKKFSDHLPIMVRLNI